MLRLSKHFVFMDSEVATFQQLPVSEKWSTSVFFSLARFGPQSAINLSNMGKFCKI